MRSLPVTVITLLCAASVLVFGVWAYFAPVSFIDYVNYAPYNEHLTHDAGAFQIGIGIGLITALLWNNTLGAALAGFVVASGLHTWSHFTDRHIGGHGTDVPLLGATTLLGIVAVVLLLRRKAA
ncbi:hypothetical protein [Kribbella sindirgiensis]|uniref:Uncharacterized protein n=1 Tax=Kribbella sindirgiensis TaxID=1124744 RepID=A0A4R0J1P1_9ACTN|nr:hypothetical protein [Kribbella sindirgiensis]TCC35055.1 hypothetical protein E0H50_14365 [Kribbella sindirgiensis]